MPKYLLPTFLAEFLGTFFLVFFGCGAVILADLGNAQVATFVPLIFAGAVTVMIHSVGHISGAHFNPAVTMAFWSIGKLPGKRLALYFCAQFLGALAASLSHLLIWPISSGAVHSFGVTAIQVSPAAGFFIEVLLSFALMFVIVSVATDSRAIGNMAGVSIGLIIALCAFVGGPLTAASMNPARTLGPAVIAGNFTHIWLYFLAPIFGATLGAVVYQWMRCDVQEPAADHGCC